MRVGADGKPYAAIKGINTQSPEVRTQQLSRVCLRTLHAHVAMLEQ